ncbi:uncharacterized protein [Drosophila pseudoobscura]|uniref:Uncharacterized protein isoform X1 n=1 Tax=Drosophila pseudoobscura pseudoobscura TaxID=46245 RepID=A0A6I8WBP2_DROPS|nr:uncharacterized protein LOC4815428 isoform X1 [Drosophila pseudoobscura]
MVNALLLVGSADPVRTSLPLLWGGAESLQPLLSGCLANGLEAVGWRGKGVDACAACTLIIHPLAALSTLLQPERTGSRLRFRRRQSQRHSHSRNERAQCDLRDLLGAVSDDGPDPGRELRSRIPRGVPGTLACGVSGVPVESRTCPICRSDDTVYLQLYLDFEEPPPSQNQSQGQSGSADSGIESVESGTEYSGIMREYENLLYETGVYREEIEYLNERIETLMLRNSQLKAKLEMSSDSD